MYSAKYFAFSLESTICSFTPVRYKLWFTSTITFEERTYRFEFTYHAKIRIERDKLFTAHFTVVGYRDGYFYLLKIIILVRIAGCTACCIIIKNNSRLLRHALYKLLSMKQISILIEDYNAERVHSLSIYKLIRIEYKLDIQLLDSSNHESSAPGVS